MKKSILTFLFFASIFCYSQNYRFVYEYKFAPNASKNDSLLTNYMYLDTDGKQSYFYNEAKFKSDSIKKVSNDLSLLLKVGRMDKNLHFTIVKDYLSRETTFYSKLSTVDFKIAEKEKPKWKLSNEKKMIGKWNCQKAETFYKGRKWVAYFTSEIQFNDGPYKFWGLPGFVVEVLDENNLHHFSLIQIKKIPQGNISLLPKNPRIVTNEQYLSYLKNYRPSISDISAVNVVNGTSTYIMKDGSTTNIHISKETLNKYEKNQERLNEIIIDKLSGQNDNPIELDKAIVYPNK